MQRSTFPSLPKPKPLNFKFFTNKRRLPSPTYPGDNLGALHSPTYSSGTKRKAAKKLPASRPLFLSHPYVTHILVKGSFNTIVELPKYVDENEWLAFNVFEFFNYINSFYASISDFCTHRECPSMSGGPGIEYIWLDSQQKKLKLSAPQYVDYVTTWIQNLLSDEDMFPTKSGREFPREFVKIVRSIFRQLIRLFAHIYHHHYDKVLCLNEESHFNALFAHFISFARKFDLLEKKDLIPLQELIDVMEQNGVLV